MCIERTLKLGKLTFTDCSNLSRPRKIKNPDFYEDKHPSNLEAMGAIGFEIWTMQSDILFDNIYIGHVSTPGGLLP
jgi:hypothetical protein